MPRPDATADLPDLDVLGIGNALVDVISHADDGFLAAQGLEKGAMNLVDVERAESLYAAMGPAVEMSGGAAANSVTGVASLGGRGAFVGRVRDDQLGALFTHDIRAAGVEFVTAPAAAGPATGRCLVLLTPDTDRTMSTYLGAAVELQPEDVDEAQVARAAVTLLEGYLWDPPAAKAAFRKAMAAARAAGRRVAFCLNDPFCVQRWRDEFLDLVEGGHVDVLFANEREITALYECGDDFDAALAAVRGRCELAVLTRHAQGSVVVAADEVHAVPAHAVDAVVDTTGAGDLYAAGFLYGLTHGLPPERCGRLGALAAAEVISHPGARPLVRLADLAAPLLDGA